jgi:hypothetical protein
MGFWDLDYEDRFDGSNKTVFRGDNLIYTVNSEDPMDIINDSEWYDRAAVQMRVWSHNIEKLQESGIPLTFDNFETDTMFYRVSDERFEGQLTAPALFIDEYESVEPYTCYDTFEDLSDEEERQIREMQDQLDQLIEEGDIAVKERECVENDYHGPGCLRQWGRNDKDDVFLLEFGEYHHRLEGPLNGEEFLDKHQIERQEYAIENPLEPGV